MPENITSLNWRIEVNSFVENYKAIRIASDQDRGIRQIPKSGELGYPAPKLAKHIIQNNKFEENIHVIDQLDALDTIISPNELKDNYYE